MLIVSFAANEHDSSVAIATDEEVLTVVEAERITRVKKQWCNAAMIERLIEFTLASVGRREEDVTHWCGTAMGNTLLPTGDRRCGQAAHLRLRLFGRDRPFTAVNHHLSHASSFFMSSLNSAVVDACDAGGDGRQHAVFEAERGSDGGCIEEVTPSTNDAFSGVFYETCSYYLFKRYVQEGRFMGLAAFGDRDEDTCAWLDAHAEALSTQPHEVSYRQLHQRFGIERFDPDDHTCRSFARCVQDVFVDRREQQVRDMAGDGRDIVLSGGTALNIHANTQIRTALPGRDVFVAPCCDDSGQALGALLYVANLELGTAPRVELPFLGLGIAHRSDDLDDATATRVVQDLLDDKVVAWHWGRAEIGPRALGHRSLLCSPRSLDNRVLVSEKVKGREPYRPVAPIILEDERGQWFSGDWPSPYMLFAADATTRTRIDAPAVAHVDGTARIQTIGDDHVLAKVLRLFAEATGTPLLINTSLNGPAEPITQTHAETRAFCAGRPEVVAYLDGCRMNQW